jgi:Predicted metal-dependent membrane protease
METEYDFSTKSVVIPLLVKLGMDMLVTFGAVVIYHAIYADKYIVGMEQDGMMAISASINGVLHYSAIIAMVSSVLLLPIFVWMFKKDRFFYVDRPDLKINWVMYLVLFVIGITASVGMNNIMMLSQVANISDSYQRIAELLYEPTFLVQIVGLGILIPIVEELLFRGIIFRRLRRIMSRNVAIGLSALIFGIIHGNLVQFIYAFFLGSMFAYLYELCASMWVPISLHILANIVAIVMTRYNVSAWMFSSLLRVGLITVGCAFVCSIMLVRVREEMLQKC